MVDTSVLIDHLRGDARAVQRLRSAVLSGDELWSATVVRTEILAGARPGEAASISALLDQLQWMDITVEVADSAGRLAACVQKLDARLLTRNVRHFPMLPDLEPAYV